MKLERPAHELARVLAADVIDARRLFKGILPGQLTEGARSYYGGGRPGVEVIPTAPPRNSSRFTNATGETPNRNRFQALLDKVQQDQKLFDRGFNKEKFSGDALMMPSKGSSKADWSRHILDRYRMLQGRSPTPNELNYELAVLKQKGMFDGN